MVASMGALARRTPAVGVLFRHRMTWNDNHGMVMPMPRKPALKPDDPAEYARFLETAKQVDADDDLEALDRAMERIIPSKHRKSGQPAG